jgi:hypothetical protein
LISSALHDSEAAAPESALRVVGLLRPASESVEGAGEKVACYTPSIDIRQKSVAISSLSEERRRKPEL